MHRSKSGVPTADGRTVEGIIWPPSWRPSTPSRYLERHASKHALSFRCMVDIVNAGPPQ
jgi:hypothetical protein